MGKRDSKYDPLRPRLSHFDRCRLTYGDRVLVRRVPQYERDPETNGPRIVAPSSADPKEGNQVGIVEAIGPGDAMPDGSRWPMTVKPGDRVIYARVPPQEFVDDAGVTHTFLFEQQHILAVLDA